MITKLSKILSQARSEIKMVVNYHRRRSAKSIVLQQIVWKLNIGAIRNFVERGEGSHYRKTNKTELV